ncbi:hypothetical protein BK730_21985 [Bacillus wiedmannii]|uniref:Uncharacterized protein n=2 Tax=Bacillus wiedmannii TaxID=1890302 RepID=A0A242Z0S4_9BACI|nr:hypothetical protein BK730_21985 [Bacillus wiedmannii]
MSNKKIISKNNSRDDFYQTLLQIINLYFKRSIFFTKLQQQTFSNIELGILNVILENRLLPFEESNKLGVFVLLEEIDKQNNSNEFITQLIESDFQLVDNIAYVRINNKTQSN